MLNPPVLSCPCFLTPFLAAEPSDEELLWRLANARLAGPRPVHRAYTADAGRTDQPSGSKRLHLARQVSEVVAPQVTLLYRRCELDGNRSTSFPNL